MKEAILKTKKKLLEFWCPEVVLKLPERTCAGEERTPALLLSAHYSILSGQILSHRDRWRSREASSCLMLDLYTHKQRHDQCAIIFGDPAVLYQMFVYFSEILLLTSCGSGSTRECPSSRKTRPASARRPPAQQRATRRACASCRGRAKPRQRPERKKNQKIGKQVREKKNGTAVA